jgi:spermidine/putrescine transport system substrate-binding protein
MNRRRFLQACASGATLALSGCADPFGALNASTTQPVKSIKILHWREYIADAVVQQFQREFGTQVLIDVATGNEQMRAAIAADASHGYDLVIARDYVVSSMIEAGLLLRLVRANLPNFANIASANRALYYDGTNSYAVPYFWGTTGVLYDPLRTQAPITNWRQLLEPAPDLIGRIGMLNDAREILAVALRVIGLTGNSIQQGDIEAARQVLLKQRRSVANYDSAQVNAQRVLAGELTAAMTSTHNAVAARRQNRSLVYALPDPVTTVRQDNMVVPRGAPSQHSAEVFINFMLRPDMAARNANDIGAATPNGRVLREKLIDPAMLNDTSLYPPLSQLGGRFEWLTRLPADADSRYAAVLAELMAG